MICELAPDAPSPVYHEINESPIETTTRITTAPTVYDYEWTVVSSKPIATGRNGRVYREVQLDTREDGYYANYQIARYHSGGYAVMTPEQWAELRDKYPDLV
jgi:hypothetical protein